MERAQVALVANRAHCEFTTVGEVCTDAVGSALGGGYWPKGTANQYVFNSGPAMAAIIGPDGGPWAGDTTGAFFFDPKGTTVHGSELVPMSVLATPGDVQSSFEHEPLPVDRPEDWPDYARIPSTGDLGGLFHPTLHGLPGPAEANLWWVTWEGDVNRAAGRPHPLGVVVETRVMAFRYPAGTDDQVYVLYTVYNASATNPAAYAGVRASMQPILLNAAERLHAGAQERFGVALPSGGWTFTDFFFGWIADNDVGDAGNNFSTTALPLGTSVSYAASFDGPTHEIQLGWSFAPQIFGAPFFAGPGFAGVTALDQSARPFIQTYTNLSGGGIFNDPQNVAQLHRYLSGGISPAVGDQACTYNPVTDHVCFLNFFARDTRDMHSWAGVTLAPGEAHSYLSVVSFAPPVEVNGFTGAPNAELKPGDPTRWNDPVALAQGANQVDSIAGFAGWVDDNGNGQVDALEVRTVTGSHYWKGQVAQALFASGFLRPQAPAAPEFFLVPGDGRVTVLWQPSATEELGDPYWTVAGSPRTPEGFPNPLYDANYRQHDVVGYRVWRGRVDRPEELELVAQFDHDGVFFRDHYGQLIGWRPDRTSGCAPELGVTADCPVAFETPVPGEALTVFDEQPISGWLPQVRHDGGRPQRLLLPDGRAYIHSADSLPREANWSGVPFLFEDTGVRNGLRYFYAVTAFDVNSVRSGPVSLESAPVLRGVTPERGAVNHATGLVAGTTMWGRDRQLDPTAPFPTMDGATGTFSGPMPPARSWSLALGQVVPELMRGSASASVVLDSITPGSSYAGRPATYWFSVAERDAVLGVPMTQPPTEGTTAARATFEVGELDAELIAQYGGTGTHPIPAAMQLELSGTYFAGGYGRGCVNGALFGPGGNGYGFAVAGSRNCAYNGSRWFDGPSPARAETRAHPIAANTGNFTGIPQDPEVTNGGYLTGVTQVFQAQSYQSASTTWRQVEGLLSSVRRSADYNVYWGAGGAVDSVIDVTHNVVVPFRADYAAASWGILNQAAAQPSGVGVSYDQRTELTPTDMTCVEPLRSDGGGGGAASHAPCGTGPGTGPVYVLSRTAVPGPIAFMNGMNTASVRTEPVQVRPGFVLYLAGNIFGFELANGVVPSTGAVWTLRDYIGAIAGGGCPTCGAGENGPYRFTPFFLQPLTAVGVELRLSWDATNALLAATPADLDRVHTVPDPYYLGSVAEPAGGSPELRFVNLPEPAIVRIYSLSGRLVRVLEHQGTVPTDVISWDLRNRRGERVAPGVYFWHVESGEATRTGRFTILDYRTGPT